MIICLDGPAGSGKSTISRTVAERAGFVFLDTGAFYRSLALFAKENDTDWNDALALSDLAKRLPLAFKSEPGGQTVYLDDKNVSDVIRTPEISQGASIVSQHSSVREQLVNLQRQTGECQSLVAEGRDTGTVVFPDAELKIYLDASLEERARRRFEDFKQSGNTIRFEEVKANVALRDKRDSERTASPLKQADDAIVLDTTALTPEEVINQILTWIEDTRAGRNLSI